mgnify:CR=1 FL=1
MLEVSAPTVLRDLRFAEAWLAAEWRGARPLQSHGECSMKFGIFYEHQLPRPWDNGAEQRLFSEALEQVELADRPWNRYPPFVADSFIGAVAWSIGLLAVFFPVGMWLYNRRTTQ